MKYKCPMCKAELSAESDHQLRPFCSSRCKKLDLANWLEGNYRLPRELLPEELEQLPREKQEELIAAAVGDADKRILH